MWEASLHVLCRMVGLWWRLQEQQTHVGKIIWNRLIIETVIFFSSPQIIILVLIFSVDTTYTILKGSRPTSPVKSVLDHVGHIIFLSKEQYFKGMVGSYAKIHLAACLVCSAGNIPEGYRARCSNSIFKSECALGFRLPLGWRHSCCLKHRGCDLQGSHPAARQNVTL